MWLKSLTDSTPLTINHIAWGTIILACIFGIGFSLAPPFEGPDEDSHFNYISYLYHEQQLPRPEEMPRGAAHHPPLYYALLSPFLALWGDADRTELLGRVNVMFPGIRSTIGGADNRNRLIHHTDELGWWPQSPTARTLRVMRATSLFWFAFTSIFLWKSLSQFIWKDQPWLALASLAAIIFNPKYLQFAGYINNDHLLWLGCALTLFLLLKIIHHGFAWRDSAALGVVLGLGLLNKFNSGMLAVPVGLTFIMLCWRQRAWVAGVKHASLTLAITLLLASPWMIFNTLRYGDPTGYIGGVNAGWEDVRVEGEFNLANGLHNAYPFAIKTFWNYLALDSVRLPALIWDFYYTLMVMTAIGLSLRLFLLKRLPPEGYGSIMLLASLAIVVVALLLVVASMYTSDNNGRYLFPAMLTWGTALIAGLSAFVPIGWRPTAAKGFIITMIVTCGIALWGSFLPAFDPQLKPMDSRSALACYALNGQPIVELVSISPNPIFPTQRQPIRVELEWRAIGVPPSNLWEYVHAVGPRNQLIGARDSIPSGGNHPSQNWKIGEQWRSTLWLQFRGRPQHVYPVEVGLYTDQQTRLTNCQHNGTTRPAQVVIHGTSMSLPNQLIAQVNPSIGLVDYYTQRYGNQLTVATVWVALQNGTQNLNLFVQVRDSNNTILAQYDGPPKRNQYPTLYWQKGERISEVSSITLPEELPEEVKLYVGFYLPPNNPALPITANGETYYAGLPLEWPDSEP